MATLTVTESESNGTAIDRPGAGNHSGRNTLPPLSRLAFVAAAPNAAVIGVSLVAGRVYFALNVGAGLLIALLMYAGIYSFVTGASSTLLSAVGGRPAIDSKAFMPLFGLLSVGKFVAMGAVLFVLVRYLHADLLQCMVGFLIAQIAITVACVRSLASRPLLGGGSAPKSG